MTTATEHLGTPSPLFSAQSRWITDWRPEDEAFWDAAGKQVARRNLIFSIVSDHIGFPVWSIWSVLVLFMGPKYGIGPAGKFLLVSVPTLIGSVLRGWALGLNAGGGNLSSALIGVAGAIGAFGGALVNLAFRQSFLSYQNGNAAYGAFLAFYTACVAVTCVVYLRSRRRPTTAA